MLPSLKEGDIVFFKNYKEGKSDPKPGQIVIFNHPLKHKNLIKRINSVNQNIFRFLATILNLAKIVINLD